MDVDNGILEVDGAGQTALNALCPVHRGGLLPGGVEVPSLKQDFIVFTISRRWCFARDSATVKLPKADVLGFLEDHEEQLTRADTIAAK